ncbi:MAG: NAD-dependent epimerase/dehydratase family protein [Anaerolineales bacterium]|nr:NAD-dependent epimerase/dehydratase family protein [Anaerolineales bacterium]
MLALVTGSTGFLGSHVCRVLLEAGHDVRAFHRSTSSLVLLDGLNVEHVIGDITQPETLRQAMQGVEGVFHTAAKVDYWRDSKGMINVTAGGTRNVLEAAMQSGVRRTVHVSSAAALGVPEDVHKHPSKTPTLLDEHHAWNYKPRWWRYGYAKYLSEREVQRAVALGQDVVIVNPSAIYGSGDKNRVSGDLIIQIAKGRLPVVFAGGMNIVHVDDVAEGILAAYKHGKRGERYILGGENLTHIELTEIIAETVGAKPPGLSVPIWLMHSLAAPVDALRKFLPLPINGDLLRFAGLYFYYDTNKAETELGITQKRTTRQAIQEAYDWYHKQGFV